MHQKQLYAIQSFLIVQKSMLKFLLSFEHSIHFDYDSFNCTQTGRTETTRCFWSKSSENDHEKHGA